MRFLALFPLALLSVASDANPPVPAPATVLPPSGEIILTPLPGMDRMNAFRQAPGCKSIPQQVAGEDRSHDGTRLNQLPRGRIILAVDRQVNGCHEVALLSEERRR